jgi:hypothetical protein
MTKKSFLFLCLVIAASALAVRYSLPIKKQGGFEDYTVSTVTLTQDLGTRTMILDAPTRTIADYVKNYVDIPKGGIDWRLLAKTKEIKIGRKTPEGYGIPAYKPEFAPAVQKLDGKEVVVKGFMFPLDASSRQKTFLFGPFPVNCPFHYHVSPDLVIEVHADNAPVEFSYDAITLKGKLQLIVSAPENSTFYRLLHARQIDKK